MWKAITEFGNKLVDRPAFFLMLAGVVFIGLGIAGGVSTYFAVVDIWRYISIGFGTVMLLWGGILANRKPVPPIKADEYGITITNPSHHEEVNVVSVKGTFKKALPDGYKLWVLRIYPDARNGIHPLKEVTFIDEKTWHANGCQMAGKTGDERRIGAYLVGPSGQALFRYYSEAANKHYALKSAKGFSYLPLIFDRTPDMVMGAEVDVKVK